jgi:hypothetical protein
MKDFLTRVWKMVEHNMGLFVGIAVCVVLAVWGWGCDSTVPSINNPETKVTREELTIEAKEAAQNIVDDYEQAIAIAEAAIKQAEKENVVNKEKLALLVAQKVKLLDQQDAAKAAVLEIGFVLAEGGAVNPLGVLSTFAGILGIGLLRDNAKKDGLITDIKASKTGAVV